MPENKGHSCLLHPSFIWAKKQLSTENTMYIWTKLLQTSLITSWTICSKLLPNTGNLMSATDAISFSLSFSFGIISFGTIYIVLYLTDWKGDRSKGSKGQSPPPHCQGVSAGDTRWLWLRCSTAHYPSALGFEFGFPTYICKVKFFKSPYKKTITNH